jgi:hypothetical protein
MKRRSFRKPHPSGSKARPRYRRSLVLNIPVLGYNTLEILPHASDRMKQRGITRDEVVETINSPTTTGLPTQAGRVRVRREFLKSGKVIDVVYDELADRVRVITTFQK